MVGLEAVDQRACVGAQAIVELDDTSWVVVAEVRALEVAVGCHLKGDAPGMTCWLLSTSFDELKGGGIILPETCALMIEAISRYRIELEDLNG